MGKGPGEESGLESVEHWTRGTPFQACLSSYLRIVDSYNKRACDSRQQSPLHRKVSGSKTQGGMGHIAVGSGARIGSHFIHRPPVGRTIPNVKES
jgi:hypothetical protein